MKDLESKTRIKLISFRCGLLDKLSLIKWVDDKISKLDNCPDYLISISLDENTDDGSNLDLLANRVNDKDCKQLAKIILNEYYKNNLNHLEIENISKKISSLLNEENEFYYNFSWISEDIYLAKQNIKELKVTMINVIKDLEEIANWNF